MLYAVPGTVELYLVPGTVESSCRTLKNYVAWTIRVPFRSRKNLERDQFLAVHTAHSILFLPFIEEFFKNQDFSHTLLGTNKTDQPPRAWGGTSMRECYIFGCPAFLPLPPSQICVFDGGPQFPYEELWIERDCERWVGGKTDSAPNDTCLE